MIAVENLEYWGFEHAVRGMRNPLNSWNKSDSYWVIKEDEEIINPEDYLFYEIGKNDLKLMQNLFKAGASHRKYLRQIFVSMDITAPLYWWAEMDTYKIGVTRDSCSFMHKGVSKPFDIYDFSIHDQRVYEILSPISKNIYPLLYKYETEEYMPYVCENGRSYRVYRNGRVIAQQFEYIDTKGRRRVFKEKECIPSVTKSGYYELHLGGRNGEKWLLHRLIATVFLDNPDNLYTVNHIDGNKGNNCVENLEWCDLSDNIQKGFNNNLYNNGKSLHARFRKWKNGHRVVSPFVKSQILNDHRQNNCSSKELANKYGITIGQANNIISHRLSEYEDLFMLCYIWENTINALNQLRNIYLDTQDFSVFQQIRCLLPCGYNQRATITMNYENVINILQQRSNHKLDEWRQFCEILRCELPYIKELENSVNEKE